MNTTTIVIITLLSITFIGCAQQQTSQREPIKIGFVGPLSGSLAGWGIPDKNGAQLAVQEINAQGGINGRQVELIAEDDRCEPQASSTAVNKLIMIDGVKAILGPICSGTLLADAPIAEANHIVMIGIGTSNPSITQAGDYIFRMWPSDAYNGKILAKLAADDGHKRVALLYVNNDYGKGISEVFATSFTDLGGALAATESFAVGTTDFRTQLTKITAATPDALIVIMSDEAPAIHKQMRDLGMRQQVYGTETYDTPALLAASNGALDGTTYTMPAFDENEKVTAFKQRYKQAFGVDAQNTIVAAYSYDAMNIILDGLRQDPTGATLKEYMNTVKQRETVGGIISFDENGDVTRDFTAKRIDNGTVVVLRGVTG